MDLPYLSGSSPGRLVSGPGTPSGAAEAITNAVLTVAAVLVVAAMSLPGSASAQGSEGDDRTGRLVEQLGILVGKRPQIPDPIAPMDGARIDGLSLPVELQWEEADRARTYDIEIDCLGCDVDGQWSTVASGRPWRSASDLAGLSYEIAAAELQPRLFRWRVRGMRGDKEGRWSRWWIFEVVAAGGGQATAASPGGAVEPAQPPPVPADIRLGGQWTASNGMSYELAQVGPRLIWSNADGGESGSAVLEAGGNIVVEQWTGTAMPTPGRGTVAGIAADGTATRIDWDNGQVFLRGGAPGDSAAAAPEPQAPVQSEAGQGEATETGAGSATGSAEPAGGTQDVAGGEGYCCVDGTVYTGTSADCDYYGGTFALDLAAAESACAAGN